MPERWLGLRGLPDIRAGMSVRVHQVAPVVCPLKLGEST